jgi:hypothetical protein
MSTTKNSRRHHRIPYLAPMRISWEDQGEQCYATARCIDLSEGGMRVEATQQVRPGTRILISAERLKLSGAASVRRTERYGGKYLLGLQFTQAIPAEKIAAFEGRPAVTVVIENFNRTD